MGAQLTADAAGFLSTTPNTGLSQLPSGLDGPLSAIARRYHDEGTLLTAVQHMVSVISEDELP